MNDTLSIVLTASAWAAGGGLAVWLVTMPLRRGCVSRAVVQVRQDGVPQVVAIEPGRRLQAN